MLNREEKQRSVAEKFRLFSDALDRAAKAGAWESRMEKTRSDWEKEIATTEKRVSMLLTQYEGEESEKAANDYANVLYGSIVSTLEFCAGKIDEAIKKADEKQEKCSIVDIGVISEFGFKNTHKFQGKYREKYKYAMSQRFEEVKFRTERVEQLQKSLLFDIYTENNGNVHTTVVDACEKIIGNLLTAYNNFNNITLKLEQKETIIPQLLTNDLLDGNCLLCGTCCWNAYTLFVALSYITEDTLGQNKLKHYLKSYSEKEALDIYSIEQIRESWFENIDAFYKFAEQIIDAFSEMCPGPGESIPMDLNDITSGWHVIEKVCDVTNKPYFQKIKTSMYEKLGSALSG